MPPNTFEVTATPEFIPSERFVSNHVRDIFEILIDLCVSSIVANVGIFNNIMILIVFFKQGFQESMNISMSAIAIWDLVKCLAGSVQRLYGPIKLVSKAHAESWANISLVVIVYHISFATYVSSVLAAYVSFERCLCVTVPFKVKYLLTPRVTLNVMIVLSVVVFGCFAIMFGVYDIFWVYSPKYNSTIAVYSYNEFYQTHHVQILRYYNLSGVIWPLASFVVIVMCTCVIVVQLRRSSKFRAESTNVSKDSSLSTRDKQIIRMLLVVIAVYVLNLLPRIVVYMAKYFIEELYFLKEYHNLFMVICYWCILLDLLNGSVNFYIFIVMSSNFRSTLLEIFRLKKKNVSLNVSP